MSLTRIVVLVERLLTAVVLVVSGGYLLVYLYRWEWNRAIISGIFFVAAEVAVATSMVLRRLRALERAEPAASPPDPAVLARLRSTDVDRPDPFAWLAPQTNRTAVFVPVLLGAGVVLSALAFVVERVAEATALPVLDRHLAGRLTALSPPSGGLTPRHTVRSVPGRGRSRPQAPVSALLAIASLGVLAWLGIGALLEASQTRPDPGDRPASTTISLEIIERHPQGSVLLSAEALWVGCRSSLGRGLPTEVDMVGPRGEQVDLVLRPGIGRLATRRITGCLTDLQLDLIRAEVLDIRHEEVPPR